MRVAASVCERAVDFGIGALVLFTPLAFGSVERWSIILLESSIFAIGAVWLAGLSLRATARHRRAVARPAEKREGGSDADFVFTTSEEDEENDDDAEAEEPRSWTPTGLATPILLFIGVVLFQLVPLPRTLLSFLSPRTSVLYERTVPGYGRGRDQSFEDWLLVADAARTEAAAPPAERRSVSVPISYVPAETRNKLLLFSSYALVFFVAAERYRDRIRRSRIFVWIVFVGVGIAIQGIFQKLTWNGKLLWFRSPGFDAHAFGPFVNSNHFAGYMELIVPLALGLLLTLLWRGSRPGGLWSGTAEPRRSTEGTATPWLAPGEAMGPQVLAWTATNPLPKAVLLGFLLALSIGSIVLSLSRGGFLATLVTFAIFARALVPPNLMRRSRAGVALAGSLAILAGILAVVFWLGASSIAQRATSIAGMMSEPSYVGRLDTWSRTLEMIRDHVVLGTGLGSYEFAFAGYYPPGTVFTWQEAHNDYLQFLAEVGVAGLIPALLALYVFLRRHFFPAVLDRRRMDRYMSLGLAMAIFSMLLHSLVDFNLQVPAVALLFVLIGALLTASSPDGEREGGAEESFASGVWRWRLKGAGAVALVAASALTAVLGLRDIEAVKVGWKLWTAEKRERDLIVRVKHVAETRPRILASFADGALVSFDDWWAAGGRPQEEAREELVTAETAYRDLATLTPLWSWGWWGLGDTYARRSALLRSTSLVPIDTLIVSSEKDLGRDARLAAAAFRTSIFLEPNSYQTLDDLARLYRDEGLHGAALETYRASARIMPLYNRHGFRSVQELPEDVYRAIEKGMEQALADPGAVDIAEIRQNLGEMAQGRGDLSTAAQQFRLGITGASTELMRSNLSLELGETLRRQNKLSEAIPLLERAAAFAATARSSWVSLGELRASQGDHRRAIEAFRAAIELAPDETWIQVRLAREMIDAGDRDGAIQKLRLVIGADPPGLEARELMVRILRERGRLSEALEEARTLSGLSTDNIGYRQLAADLARQVDSPPPGIPPRP